ncbi:Methylmalonate-semialdehyde dehydrogenase [Datura stramonium]|uniref:Methylmalonate-semialdehyde dehydrogenase [acylating], mitochondrial n=1 Tax=Datura stramonium TaxID=4076 RepID=A0ABS8SFX3_DATST|nr:Methylmalonate-semialdehyde dehydrogenase [acylating], mitochondrial [Datura stramonium]
MHILRASAKGKRVQWRFWCSNKIRNVSTVVFVGDSKPWEEKLLERAKTLKVSAGTEPDADLGPVISKQVGNDSMLRTVCRLVQSGVDSGAKLLLDGRNIVVAGYEKEQFC